MVWKELKDCEALSFNPETLKVEWKPIKGMLKQDKNGRLKEITLNNGRKITTTCDHEFFVPTYDGFYKKEAGQLKVGDYIPLLNGYEETKQYIKIRTNNSPNQNNGKNNRRFNGLSNEFLIDEDFGYLVGMYLGDGMVDYQSLRFFYGIKEKDYAEETKRILQIKFNCKNVVIRRVKNVWLVSVYNKEFLSLFEQLNLKGNAHTKKIPPFIFDSPDTVKARVIQGLLDSDGHIRKKGKSTEIIFSTVSEDLGKQTCILLDLLGINNCLRREKKEWLKNKNHTPRWIIGVNDYLSIKKLNDLINLDIPLEKLTKNQNSFKIIPINIIDTNRWKMTTPYKSGKSIYGKYKFDRQPQITFDKALTHTDQKFVHSLTKSNLNFTKITNIKEKRYIGDVYDIEVTDNHNFLTYSGIFTSNCRWKKSFLREALITLSFAWKRSKVLFFETLFNFTIPFISLPVRLSLIASMIFFPYTILPILASIITIAMIRNLPIYFQNKKFYFYSIPYAFLHEFGLYWLFYKAGWELFIMKDTKWGTR